MANSKTLAITLFLITISFLKEPCIAQTHSFYVSPDGSDTNPGTLDRPLASLEAARDAVRELKRQSSTPQHITVWLRGGLYPLEHTLVLNSEDSGAEQSPIVWAAYKNETPVISGAVAIRRWTPVNQPLAGQPQASVGKLWKAAVPEGFCPHFLFVDDRPQPLSRFPNEGFFEGDEGIQHFGDPGPGGQQIVFPDHLRNLLGFLPSNGDVEMSWIPIVWANGISVLRDFDAAAMTAMRHSKNILYPGNPAKDWMRGNRFALLNAIPFIDQPGEWCVDTHKKEIYWWPTVEDPNTHTVMAPKLFELIRVEGDEEKGQLVEHLEFRGLTFQYTDRLPEDQWPDEWLKRNFENPDAALFFSDIRHITIEQCRILHVGTYGITMNDYAQDNRIIACEIGYTGCGAIQFLGYGPGTKDVNKRNIVTRCVLHHVGNSNYLHSAAISPYQSGHNAFTYNYIYDCPYAGIVPVGVAVEHFNLGHRWGWAVGKWIAGHTDAYGNYEQQYMPRWEELPEGLRENMLNNSGTLSHEEFTRFIHVRDNVIAYNILSNCMNGLADGGALYCFGVSPGNRYEHNIVRNSHDKSIYLDDYTGGTIVLGNIGWGKSGTISKINGGHSDWKNCRFGGANRPEGYADLFFEIKNKVDAQGGWPAPIDLQLPSVNILIPNGRLFFDTTVIEIQNFVPGSEIRYAVNPSAVTGASKRYQEPFAILDSMTLSAAAFKDGRQVGETDTLSFVKIPAPIQPEIAMPQTEVELVAAADKIVSFNSDIPRVLGTAFIDAIPLYCGDELKCPLKPEYRRFVAVLGIDDVSDARGESRFELWIDDERVYQTPLMNRESTPIQIDVAIPSNSSMLRLRGTGPKGWYYVFGDWIDAGFIR